VLKIEKILESMNLSPNKVKQTPFSWRFLLPQYWPTWLAMLLLYVISWLPNRLQWQVGKGLGWLLSRLAKKRVAIARRNIQLCFPQWSEAEQAKLLQDNINHAGMAILETSMGWWWPDWRVKGLTEIEGYEHVEKILAKGKGVLGLVIHNMNLEMGCRVAGLHHPSVAFYRKHNNPLMEFLQHRGRARSNKYLIHKRDIRGMIRALDAGELCFYFPDQDYGRKQSEFVPFFAVDQVATTKGTLMFASKGNCETVMIASIRTEDGYKIKYFPPLENFPSGDDKVDVTRVNHLVEEAIMLAPAQYLWMHKRFKTRPEESAPSLY
jgi:Kdo2-lipid IVA lauroyltransferase/acyltransferase